MNRYGEARNSLKFQYERFPYPPISSLALPKRGQGQDLKLPTNPERILVIGCGTFEPLVVAQAHPSAKEIVCIDLSEHSIQILNRRIRLFKIARPFTKLPKIRTIAGDFVFAEFEGAEFEHQELFKNFDYVIASNVLHHSKDPVNFLAKATAALKIGGTLRVVTYPASSRIWMRATSHWLKLHGVDKSSDLKKAAKDSVKPLPISHPIRACYESHQERSTPAGITDAFFNACENPLSPLQWKEASEKLGLKLVAETQDKNSSSHLVDDFAKTSLDTWEKLQIVDDSWELCSNPIFWFEKTSDKNSETLLLKAEAKKKFSRTTFDKQGTFTSPLRQEMSEQFSRAEKLIQRSGHSFEQWINWLTREIGPRVWPNTPDEILRGLSITEYPTTEILKLSQSVQKAEPDWDHLQKQYGQTHHLEFTGLTRSFTQTSKSWRDQAELASLILGPFQNEIEFKIV